MMSNPPGVLWTNEQMRDAVGGATALHKNDRNAAHAICQSSLDIGIIIGIEEAARILMDIAGQQFCRGEDNLAQYARGLARQLESEARKRNAAPKGHPTDTNRADWDRLEQLVERVPQT